MLTQSTMGTANDAIVMEAMAQVTRAPERGVFDFVNLQSEMERS